MSEVMSFVAQTGSIKLTLTIPKETWQKIQQGTKTPGCLLRMLGTLVEVCNSKSAKEPE